MHVTAFSAATILVFARVAAARAGHRGLWRIYSVDADSQSPASTCSVDR
jgi:hypothetical protein